MQKNTFVLRNEYLDIFMDLSEKQAGILIKAVFLYAVKGEIFAGLTDEALKMAFKFVKKDIDYDSSKYLKSCYQNALNGKKGGAPKGNSNAQKQPKQPKQPTACFTTENKRNNPIDSDSDVDSDKTTITPLPPLKGKESLDFVSDEFKPIFQKWLDYKKEKKQTYKGKLSLQQCYKQLLELSNNNVAIAEKVVNQSIANNWAGLFDLRENKTSERDRWRMPSPKGKYEV